jgi:predicted DsbA family dithiol-disulfide isomerase
MLVYNHRMATELLYFHDPMCSWCWAFRPAFMALHARLPKVLTLRRVVGGLAPDNDQPMPEEMARKAARDLADDSRDGPWHSLQLCILGELRAKALDV